MKKFFSKKMIIVFVLSLSGLHCENFRDRSRDIRNRGLRDNPDGSDVIRSLGVDSEYGKYNKSDYEGPTCKDGESDEQEICEDKCRKMYRNEWRKCREVPISLIEEMEENFESIKRLQWLRDGRDAFRQGVDTFLFGVMIDIDVESALTLISSWRTRNSRNMGGVVQFLIWVAETASISRAILVHDENLEIYSKAFEVLGRLDVDESNLSKASYIKAGMSVDLESYTRTFLGIAADPSRRGRDLSQDRVSSKSLENEFAMQGFHLLLQERVCTGSNSRQCKLEVYCARDRIERTLSSRGRCPYRRSKSFGTRYCYAHQGAWGFFNSLITSGRIEDRQDFRSDDRDHLNADECKDMCDDHSRCNRSSLS